MGLLASLELITKLASSPHILQHLNAAKYGFSEGRGVAFSNATPRFCVIILKFYKREVSGGDGEMIRRAPLQKIFWNINRTA